MVVLLAREGLRRLIDWTDEGVLLELAQLPLGRTVLVAGLARKIATLVRTCSEVRAGLV